jgi:hypothetical protein
MTKPAPLRAALFLFLFAAAGSAAGQAQEQPAATQTQPREQPVDVDAPDPAEAEPPARAEPAERPVRTRPAPAPDPVDIPSGAGAPPPTTVIIDRAPPPTPMPVPIDPYLTANTVEILPGEESFNEVEVYPEVTTTTTTEQGGGWAWPLIIAAILLLLGTIAFLIARGGRRRPETVIQRHVTEDVPLAPAAPVAAVPVGRPRIDLRMRPIRAGIEAEGARIEFELTVLNEGAVEAQDVRVSTWMTANPGLDATRALVPPPGHVGTPPVALGAGEARTLQASVALPRAQLSGASLLPAVVADIRYTLPGGREGRTAAAFSVGLPAGDELGAFPLDGAAGLHANVIAVPLGQAVKT